jgi:hypothetical protein
MSTTEYVSVFVAIIIGLAVADLLLSLHKLLRAGPRVKWDWLTPALALQMLLLTVSFWWVSHNWYQGVRTMSVAEFLPDLAVFMLLFLTVAAVLPDDVPKTGIDLRAYYLSSSRYVWTLIALSLASSTLLIALRFPVENAGPLAWLAARGDNLAVAAAAAVPIFTRRVWVHGLVIALILGSSLASSIMLSIGN